MQAQIPQPKILSLKRKCEFRYQNLKSLKRNCKFRNKNSKRFKAQTQILQPKIENSTAQLRIDCLRSAHKFRFLKKFLNTNFCIIEVSKDDGVKQGWQYGTTRICVLRTLHLQPYHSSVPYFSSIFEAYRTNVPYPYHYKKGVPFLHTVLLSKN